MSRRSRPHYHSGLEWILGVAFEDTLTRPARLAQGFTHVRCCGSPRASSPHGLAAPALASHDGRDCVQLPPARGCYHLAPRRTFTSNPVPMPGTPSTAPQRHSHPDCRAVLTLIVALDAIFVDAVHPTHAARPVGCWAPKEQKLAIEQTSGRERINIHGAIDLETGQTRMIEAETIDAISTIRLLESLESLYPLIVCIHVFLDNARYHHAKLVKEWLARPSCRIKLHFLPTYCPHLNPIERLWGVMHKNITHNKCYGTCGEFAETTLEFLRDEVPRRWAEFCDSVTDNFRIISPKDFRLLG